MSVDSPRSDASPAVTGDAAATGDPTTGPDGTAAGPQTLAVNHVQLAAISAVLAGALALGVAFGTVGTLIAVAAVQAVLIPSWVLGNGLPGRIGAIVLGTLAAGAADAATMHWPDSGYSPVLGVLGLAIPLMFAHQLTRGVVRSRVVESLAGITLLVVGLVALAGLIVLRHEAEGRTLGLAVVGAAGVALVVAHLTDGVLPAPRFDPAMDRGLPAVVLGVIAGGVLGQLALRRLIDFAGGRAAFVGGAVAAVACLLSIGASFAESRSVPQPGADRTGEDEVPWLAVSPRWASLRPAGAVALTLALTVPAAYVLTNALTS